MADNDTINDAAESGFSSEEEYWNAEAIRISEMAKRAKVLGVIGPNRQPVTPPELNDDGSLRDL